MGWVAVAGAMLVASVPATPQARFVSPLVKIRPGDGVLGKSTGSLSAARGECEGLQLHVAPPARDVKLHAPALRGRGGSLPLELLTVGYVEVVTPSNREGEKGLWPDPLLPVKVGATLESTPERPLVYYLRVCVPPEQRAGAYGTTLTLTVGERVRELPLSLDVQPFTLPATSSLPNTFGLSRYSIAKGHGLAPESPEAQALLAEYAKSLLRHRLSAYGMGVDPPPARFEDGKAILDFSQYDREMAPFLEGTALPGGARFTTTDLRKPPRKYTAEQRIAYYRAFKQHFDKKKWKTELFYYAKDEPKPEHHPEVLREAEEVHRAGNIRVLVTATVTPGLTQVADILAPVLNCFFTRSGLASCEQPRNVSSMRGDLHARSKVFWYQSCMSHGCGGGPMEDEVEETAFTRWASYMVDHPAPRNRAMGPLAFLTGVDGELYFDTVWAYNEGDPWKSVWAFGGNGDGTLFYPGTPDRTGKHLPVESLRLEHIRDGLEDYEYLRLAEKRGARKAAETAVRGWVRSGYDVTLEAAHWERVRMTLTRILKTRGE